VDVYFSNLVAARRFGGVVLIARGDALLVQRVYGKSNYELDVPMKVTTRFRIASLSKAFTAATIAVMAGQGRLSIQDTLARYLDGFPVTRRMTIRHLLRHESGVSNPDYAALFGRSLSLDELVALILAKPLLFEPGTDGRYSNAGYNLLAAVIERAGGRPYGEAVGAQVLDPLGLRNTGDASGGAIIEGLAAGYLPGPPPSGLRPLGSSDASTSVGAGSLYSTAPDLLRFLGAIYQDRLYRIREQEYPYGWGRRKWFGETVLEQSGLTDGFSSTMAVSLDSGYAVVVLSNLTAPSFGQWARDLLAIAHRQPVTPLPSPPRADSARTDLGAYAGTFAGDGFAARVYPLGGFLYLELNAFPIAKYLASLGGDRFAPADENGEIRFVRDAAGRVGRLEWSSGGPNPITLIRQP
jgi:CubicO group peptidase (beta-lactamase class C family)